MRSVLTDALDNGNNMSEHRQAVNAIVEIVSVVEGFRVEDYGYLDGTLSVSDGRSVVNTRKPAGCSIRRNAPIADHNSMCGAL